MTYSSGAEKTKLFMLLIGLVICFLREFRPLRAQTPGNHTFDACSGIERIPTSQEKLHWQNLAEKQLKVGRLEVTELFESGDWLAVHVQPRTAEPAFLFYRSRKDEAVYKTIWAGAASPDEAQEIILWASREMPGIDRGLSQCFAWFVNRA